MGAMSTPHGDVPPPTLENLERAALRYLERYASSRANLRRVLMRRVLRAARGDELWRRREADWSRR